MSVDRPSLAACLGGRNPVLCVSPEICQVIYTTNAVESLNRVIRMAIKTRGSFPSEVAAEKLTCLAIRGHEKTPGRSEDG